MVDLFRAKSVLWAVGLSMLLAMGLAAVTAGCRRDADGPWEFKRWGGPRPHKGEPWTILCLDVPGPEGRQAVEVLAEALKRTRGLEADRVRVVHDGGANRLYYGTYHRFRDRDTGEWRMPPELRRDMGFIRQLAAGPSYPFLLCSPVPQDTARVGPPEWDLSHAPGDYTLLVAVYSEMPERREAAVEHVKLLREQGEQAYYHHHMGKSHVCLGAFPASAVQETRRGVLRINHPEFTAARRRHPYFIYNGQYVSNVDRSAGGHVVSKSRQPTRLVRVPKTPGQGW